MILPARNYDLSSWREGGLGVVGSKVSLAAQFIYFEGFSHAYKKARRKLRLIEERLSKPRINSQKNGCTDVACLQTISQSINGVRPTTQKTLRSL